MKTANLALAVAMFLAMVSGSSALEIGGGSGILAAQDSCAGGEFKADISGAISSMSTSGTIPHAGEIRYVQDSTGKRADLTFTVSNSTGTDSYKATFSPKEGMLGKSVPSVSATQTLKVTKADSVGLCATANYSGSGDRASSGLVVDRVGATPASLSGMTLSTATGSSATARFEGKVSGAIYGQAGYGNVTKDRNSEGEKVEGSVVMQASSKNGIGAFSGISTFAVDSSAGEKIGAAINASWDGDTINVARGAYCENLVLNRNITVKGAGSANTIVDGNMFGPVFIINRNATASLSDMSIVNGLAERGGGICNIGTVTVAKCILSGNTGNTGGAVYSNNTATIDRSTISGNLADNGGGVYGEGILTVKDSTISLNDVTENGGGIYCKGMATVTKTTLSRNSASYAGGALFNDDRATVTGCTISSNSAQENGGGIGTSGTATTTITKSTLYGNYALAEGGAFYNCATAFVTDSTLSGNSGPYGGGILNIGDVTVTGCTITGGTSVQGGGVLNDGLINLTKCTISKNAAIEGAGLYSENIANMDGCTVSDNSASQKGGGIWNAGTMDIKGSKITGNSAKLGGGIWNSEMLTIEKSTISKNSATNAAGIWSQDHLDVTGNTISSNAASQYAGGIFSVVAANVTDCVISKNTAGYSGGGIAIGGLMNITGTTQITDNRAGTGFGGGIYSAGDVTFSGKKVSVKNNKAYMPASPGNWSKGYGVYFEDGRYLITGGFDPAKQVTGNIRA